MKTFHIPNLTKIAILHQNSYKLNKSTRIQIKIINLASEDIST